MQPCQPNGAIFPLLQTEVLEESLLVLKLGKVMSYKPDVSRLADLKEV